MPDNQVSQIPQVNNASHRKPSWPISTERKNDNPLVVNTTISTAPAVGAGFYVLSLFYECYKLNQTLDYSLSAPERAQKRSAVCVLLVAAGSYAERTHTLRDIPI